MPAGRRSRVSPTSVGTTPRPSGVDHTGGLGEVPDALVRFGIGGLSSAGRTQVRQDGCNPAVGVRLLVVAEFGEDGADVLLDDGFGQVQGLGDSGVG